MGVPLNTGSAVPPGSGDSVRECHTTFTARFPECGGDTEICP